MNNKGFIATSLIYSFVLVFILLMTLTINNYLQNEEVSSRFSSKVRGDVQKTKIKQTVVNGNPESMVNYIKYLVVSFPKSSAEVIKLSSDAPDGTCENTFAYDLTADNNLRYVGANPCNYLKFNNELWRIVGVFNNIDDGFGNKETRIKIVRYNSLGMYSFDKSNGTNGSGNYAISDIMKELNTDYLTKKDGTTKWVADNNAGKIYDFSNGLSEESQKQAGNAVWYLGSFNSADGATAYRRERNNFNSDIKTYTGKIGLLHPSDLAFSIGSDQRTTCLNSQLTNFTESNCYKTYIGTRAGSGASLFTINSYASESKPINISIMDNFTTYIASYSDIITGGDAKFTYNVFPVLYLKADVAYSSGYGSKNNPYILR